MKVKVEFYSYFKELTGIDTLDLNLRERSTIGDLLGELYQRFPRLRDMDRSTLIAVDLEYQDASFILNEGDEVALFPPVQGG